MVLSMTGFGRNEGVYQGKKITVELKSLNSKSFDLNMRLPMRYREKEFEIRKLLNDKILRGKVDCFVNVENLSEQQDVKLNTNLIQAYMQQLRELSPDGPDYEYLKMAVKFPEAVSTRPDELSDDEWLFLQSVIAETIQQFEAFRRTEGEVLCQELTRNIENIAAYLADVEPFENARIQAVRERYENALKAFDNVDDTRFYQELAYQTEKLDISEEKVRLAQHLKYYREVMVNENFNGKKLGFIAQEIGREVNTLGSKANQADIQRLVVLMKDDLEKIKEQTLNVL